MSNISDQTGRAFEYVIVKELAMLPGVSLTDRAKVAQLRDKPKFESLEDSRREELSLASRALVRTLCAPPFTIGNSIIDRLQDNEAIAGDVTDIRIQSSGSRPPINLSVKNNHFALKHQRPPSLMQQLGFVKGGQVDIEYRRKLNKIFQSFYSAANHLCPNAKLFSDLKNVDDLFIDRCLYAPVCDLVSSVLKMKLCDSNTCKTFFRFLVGYTDYVKVVLHQGRLEFTNFSQIVIPTSCIVQYTPASPNYIFLTFDNNWKISMRLHTANSKLGKTSGTPSVKFDTQPLRMPLVHSCLQCR